MSDEPRLSEIDEIADETVRHIQVQMLVVTQKCNVMLSLSVCLMIHTCSETVGVQSRPVRNKQQSSRFEGFSMY